MLLAIGTFNDGQATLAATTTVVAQTGQAVPDGNGIFLNFSEPYVQDNSGVASFVGNLTTTSGGTGDNSGIYAGIGGQLTQLVRKGEVVPGGGSISSFESHVVISEVGQLAFRAALTGTGSPVGIYRRDNGSLTQIARTGQVVPGGDGTISNLFRPTLNNAGQLTFVAGLSDTLGGSANDSAVYRGVGGTLTQIARKGQTAPDGNGSLNLFDYVFIGSVGQVTFGATLLNTVGGSTDDYGIFNGAGSQLTQIVREGQMAPDGNGRLTPSAPRSANNSGQVIFRAHLTGTAAPGMDDQGIFRGDGGLVTEVARRGQTAPDGNGRFSGFTEPVVNDLGEAAFVGFLEDTVSPGSDGTGIFRGSGNSLTQIVRAGQSAPDGNGTFSGFSEPNINNHGQIAFQAGLNNTIGGADSGGIFIYDENLGLREVVRTRQTLLGRLIVSVRLQLQLYNMGNGLNESGQVAYWFQLADGYQGVAIWSANVPGDYNSDDVVDAADYVAWRKNDGTQAGYDMWRANFGTTLVNGVGSASTIVPERPSLLLAVAGVVGIVGLGCNFRLHRPTEYM